MSDTFAKEITRRGFMSKVGQGLVAANFAGTLLKGAAAQQVPDAPGKKLGWAIVGLGSLAINQILPAFAKCEKSKVVALVSGHPDKANKLAARYGVDSKNIYNYQNYDQPWTIRKSTLFTSCCRTACMLNTQFAGIRRGQACAVGKAHG
jgi:hypothetical protein